MSALRASGCWPDAAVLRTLPDTPCPASSSKINLGGVTSKIILGGGYPHEEYFVSNPNGYRAGGSRSSAYDAAGACRATLV